MRSLIMLFCFIFISAGFVFAGNHDLKGSSLTGRICIERPENMGFLNIVPTKIEFNNYQKLSLLGGQQACILVEPGDYSFKIKSIDPSPYSHKGKPKKWQSATIKVHVNDGETVTFIVSPEVNKNGYAGSWNATPIKK